MTISHVQFRVVSETVPLDYKYCYVMYRFVNYKVIPKLLHRGTEGTLPGVDYYWWLIASVILNQRQRFRAHARIPRQKSIPAVESTKKPRKSVSLGLTNCSTLYLKI